MCLRSASDAELAQVVVGRGTPKVDALTIPGTFVVRKTNTYWDLN